MCSSVYEVILFKAAFSVAFFGAFWVGELVSPSRGVAGGFMVQDVGAAEDRVVLRLRKSKTDQRGKGVRIELSCPLPVHCLVRGFAQCMG